MDIDQDDPEIKELVADSKDKQTKPLQKQSSPSTRKATISLRGVGIEVQSLAKKINIKHNEKFNENINQTINQNIN